MRPRPKKASILNQFAWAALSGYIRLSRSANQAAKILGVDRKTLAIHLKNRFPNQPLTYEQVKNTRLIATTTNAPLPQKIVKSNHNTLYARYARFSLFYNQCAHPAPELATPPLPPPPEADRTMDLYFPALATTKT